MSTAPNTTAIGFRQRVEDKSASESTAKSNKDGYKTAVEAAALKAAKAKAQVDSNLIVRQEAARQTNTPVLAQIEAADRRFQDELSPLQQREDSDRSRRELAHSRAAQLASLCGAQYDRENLDREAPFIPTKMSHEEACGRLGLMEVRSNWEWLTKGLSVLATVALGPLLGISLGIHMGLVEPDISLNLEPDRVGPFLSVLFAGCLLAFIFGYGAERLAHWCASQRQTRGWTWPTYVAFGLTGILLIIGIIGDAAIQMSGLVSLARMTNLGEEAIPDWLFLAMSLVFAILYFSIKVVRGSFKGLNDSADVLAKRLIETSFREEMERRRSIADCREASAAIGEAINAEAALRETLAEKKALKEVYERHLAALNSSLIPFPDAPTPDEQLSIRESELRLLAAQADLEEARLGTIVASGDESHRGASFRRMADDIARKQASLI